MSFRWFVQRPFFSLLAPPWIPPATSNRDNLYKNYKIIARHKRMSYDHSHPVGRLPSSPREFWAFRGRQRSMVGRERFLKAPNSIIILMPSLHKTSICISNQPQSAGALEIVFVQLFEQGDRSDLRLYFVNIDLVIPPCCPRFLLIAAQAMKSKSPKFLFTLAFWVLTLADFWRQLGTRVNKMGNSNETREIISLVLTHSFLYFTLV